MEQQDQIRKDENYMRKAIAEAQEAYKAGEIPVGAIVVCRDRIISRAHNLTETLCDVTAHAEMQAITAAAVRSPPGAAAIEFPSDPAAAPYIPW